MEEKINQEDTKQEINMVEEQLKDKILQKTDREQNKKSPNNNTSILREFVSSNRDYINNYIILADTKAAVLIGISSGFLITLYEKYHLFFLKNIKAWNLLDMVSFLSLSSLVLSITFAIFVIFPRLITNKNKGLVSWVDISNYESSNEYLVDLLKQDEEQIIKENFSVNYFLSIVCRKKYYWLSIAFMAILIGICLGILVLVNI